jgi:hypothetical protein
VPQNTVRELLGDSSITMSLRYAHLAPDQQREAVAKLNDKPLLALTMVENAEVQFSALTMRVRRVGSLGADLHTLI